MRKNEKKKSSYSHEQDDRYKYIKFYYDMNLKEHGNFFAALCNFLY